MAENRSNATGPRRAAGLSCIAIAIQDHAGMKTTTIPPLRVSPELRREAEAVLREGETLSGFMLESLQGSIARRRDQQEFIERGLKSAAKARRTGQYVTADDVVKQLSVRLNKARARSRG